MTIEIPSKEEIILRGMKLNVVPHGDSWHKDQLGKYASKSGVYIHHTHNKILYVGKATDGTFGCFSERLRRECQEKASSNSRLYRSLLSLKTELLVSMYDMDEIEAMFQRMNHGVDKRRKALIIEQILIGVLKPKLNKE